MSGRLLRAWVNQTEVGTLTDLDGIGCFQCATARLGKPNAFAPSPNLPLTQAAQRDGSTRRHVQWYLDHLLPEEGRRVLLAKDASVDDAATTVCATGVHGRQARGTAAHEPLALLGPRACRAAGLHARQLTGVVGAKDLQL